MLVKLVDMRHALLGDRIEAAAAEHFFSLSGVPFCGGDVHELRQSKEETPSHVILWGGGGLLYETAEETDGFLNKDTWNLLGILEDKNIKLAIIGTGYNRHGSTKFMSAWKELLDRATYISLRDEQSIKKCKELTGAKTTEKYSFAPCPGFSIRNQIDRSLPRRIGFAAYSVGKEKIKIGTHQSLLSALRKQGMSIVFCPHGLDDDLFYKENNFVTENDYLIDLRESPLAALQLLASAEIHIASRLHALVASVITNTPFLHVRWDLDKVFWQASQIGLKDYEYGFSSEKEDYEKEIFSLRTKRINIQEQLSSIADEAARKAEHHFEIANLFLGREK